MTVIVEPALLNKKPLLIESRRSKSGSTYNVFYFECACGESIKAQSSQLKTHSGKCRKCTQKIRPYEHILNELKHTCKKKGYTFTITYEEFLTFIDRPCNYCDKKLAFNKHTRDSNSNYVSRAYQLDRKNNSLGYTIDNVVPCCWECNRLKSNIYSYEEFMRISVVLKQINKERE